MPTPPPFNVWELIHRIIQTRTADPCVFARVAMHNPLVQLHQLVRDGLGQLHGQRRVSEEYKPLRIDLLVVACVILHRFISFVACMKSILHEMYKLIRAGLLHHMLMKLPGNYRDINRNPGR